jgi:predicted nucleic acid-binding protein
MNAILDTNFIYYVTNIEKSEFNAQKIIDNLSQFDHVYISELSMLEIYSHFRNDINILKKILNILSELKYPVWPYFDNRNTIVNNEFNEMIKKDDFLKFLTDDSLRIRINVETTFLIYWISTISTLFLSTKITKEPIKGIDNLIAFNKSFLEMVLSLNLNDNKFRSMLWNDLYNYYQSGDESAFKDKMVDYLLNICEYFTIMPHVTEKGITFFDFIGNYDTYSGELKNEIIDKIASNDFYNRIAKRKLTKKVLIKKEFIDILKSNIDHYKIEMDKNMAPGVVRYYIVLFEKFLTLNGKKIEKNNIIDSLLLSYYPKNLLITADHDFLMIIKEFDNTYYNTIDSFIKKCKT